MRHPNLNLGPPQGLGSPLSIAFAAVSADYDRRAAAAYARWQHVHLLHMPPTSIHQLGVAIVPSRLVIDCRTGCMVRWWDGEHGRVLKGKHGKSRSNGSHDLLGTLVELL
jgi:hypothetical protein